MKAIRVVLADRDELVLAGVRMVLEPADDIEVVGFAGNGEALLDEVRERRPDVVVLDVTLPVLNGVAATRCLRTLHPSCQTVLLTTHPRGREVIEGIQAGARGFLLKTHAGTDLATAVRTVARQEPFVHAALLAPLFDVVRRIPLPAAPAPAPMLLSARERAVLQLVAAGLANAVIAARLNITVATVKRHLSTIFAKLAVANRTEAITAAQARHLL